MRILLAGLWARRGLNLAALLVIVVAVTAAVLAPMYGRASAEHVVDSRLEARAPYTTGLSYSVQAMDDPPVGSPSRFTPPDPQQLVDQASAAVEAPERARFWPAETPWLLDRHVDQAFLSRFLTERVADSVAHDPSLADSGARWLRRRLADPGTRVVVGHRDLLVLPTPCPELSESQHAITC